MIKDYEGAFKKIGVTDEKDREIILNYITELLNISTIITQNLIEDNDRL